MKAITADWLSSAKKDIETIGVQKTHNLLTLKAAVERKQPISLDEDTLSLLNKLYISSRYPGELGLLPTGAPTLGEARDFAHFARHTLEQISGLLSGE